jgi:hypothetical protein
LFENPANVAVRKDFDTLMSQLTNPFTLMRNWLKFEILELEAIFEALAQRNEIEKRFREILQKYQDGVDELRKLETGGLNMQSFISLISTKESIERKKATLKESLPIQDIEIANTRLHLMLVTF